MQDVYTGPADDKGPQVLRWDPGKTTGTGGRPSVSVLQDMFDLAFTYAKFTSSSGLSVRQPMPPPVISDHDLPRPPGLPADGSADPANARPMTLLDILLAILAFAIYLAELAAGSPRCCRPSSPSSRRGRFESCSTSCSSSRPGTSTCCAASR